MVNKCILFNFFAVTFMVVAAEDTEVPSSMIHLKRWKNLAEVPQVLSHDVEGVEIIYPWKCDPLRPAEVEAGGHAHKPSEPHSSYTWGFLNSVPYTLSIKCSTLIMCTTLAINLHLEEVKSIVSVTWCNMLFLVKTRFCKVLCYWVIIIITLTRSHHHLNASSWFD